MKYMLILLLFLLSCGESVDPNGNDNGVYFTQKDAGLNGSWRSLKNNDTITFDNGLIENYYKYGPIPMDGYYNTHENSYLSMNYFHIVINNPDVGNIEMKLFEQITGNLNVASYLIENDTLYMQSFDECSWFIDNGEGVYELEFTNNNGEYRKITIEMTTETYGKITNYYPEIITKDTTYAAREVVDEFTIRDTTFFVKGEAVELQQTNLTSNKLIEFFDGYLVLGDTRKIDIKDKIYQPYMDTISYIYDKEAIYHKNVEKFVKID